jgi:hypothetical protein
MEIYIELKRMLGISNDCRIHYTAWNNSIEIRCPNAETAEKVMQQKLTIAQTFCWVNTCWVKIRRKEYCRFTPILAIRVAKLQQSLKEWDQNQLN